MDSEPTQGSSTMSAPASVGPQIRSRITVVCAECKRLKLKCDRRNPCGSCTKRDTVARCIYSPAAAEKVDLHSLNNRLMQVEALLAQMTSGQFIPPHPISQAPPPPPFGPPQTSSSSSNSVPPASSSSQPLSHSSFAIPLEEAASTWLDDLDLGIVLPGRSTSAQSESARGSFSSSMASTTEYNVKLEPTSVPLSLSVSESENYDDRPATYSPIAPFSSAPSITSYSRLLARSETQLALPPLSIYYNKSQGTSSSDDSPHDHPHIPSSSPTTSAVPLSSFPPSYETQHPTPALLALLPPSQKHHAPSMQNLILLAEQSTAYTHPSLNWKHFRSRAMRMRASPPSSSSTRAHPPSSKDGNKEKRAKEARARAIFFGGDAGAHASGSSSGPGADADVDMDRADGRSDESSSRGEEGLSFFAAVCAALALGTCESSAGAADAPGDGSTGDAMVVDAADISSTSSSRKSKLRKPPATSQPASTPSTVADAGYWYALSVQALGVYESSLSSQSAEGVSSDYDLDYLVASLLQIVFLVKRGAKRRSGLDASSTGRDTTDEKTSNEESQRKGKFTEDSDSGVDGVVFPLVGKIVNIARQMGLNRDPDEFKSSSSDSAPHRPGEGRKSKNKGGPSGGLSTGFTLFESEMRRRIWWDVFYYDLFVSDAMGHPPLIPDNSYSTRYPASGVDEEAFGPSSTWVPLVQDVDEGHGSSGSRYLEVRCRFAELIRAIKKRMQFPAESILGQATRYGYGYSSPTHSCKYTIDQAASMESDIRNWLLQLPPAFHMDLNPATEAAPLETRDDLVLAAQRCEISIMVNRLVMRIYLPFLRKPCGSSVTTTSPHQASYGTVNAAHSIVHASQLLQSIWNAQGPAKDGRPSVSQGTPALFDFYPPGRIVFDAAVVCAHAFIKEPMTMWAQVAIKDVDAALAVLKDEGLWRGSGGLGLGAQYEVVKGDAIRIVETLAVHMESLRSQAGSSHPAIKRKHDQVENNIDTATETQALSHRHHELPPRLDTNGHGADIINILPTEQHPPPSPMHPNKRTSPTTPYSREDGSNSRSRLSSKSSSEKGGKTSKKHSYPSVGIRVRPGKEGNSPLSRPNTGPLSVTPTTPSSVGGSSEGRARPFTPMVSTPRTPNVAQTPIDLMAYRQPSDVHIIAPQQLHYPESPANDLGYPPRSPSIPQDHRMQHVQQQLEAVADYPVHYAPAEAGLMEMHISQQQQQRRYSVDHHPHAPPEPQTYPQNSPVAYDLSYAPKHGYDGRQPEIVQSHPEGYGAAVSPYGPPSSGGGQSTASSPYATTSLGTPTYGAEPHDSPQPFVQPRQVPQTYYPYHPSYEATATSLSDPRHAAAVTPAVGSIDGNVDDGTNSPLNSMYERPTSVSYDVKPSLDTQNLSTIPYHLSHPAEPMGPPQAWQSAPQSVSSEQSQQYWGGHHPDDYKYYQ